MDKIMNRAEDKNVAVRVVYSEDGSKIYYDSEFENEVPATDCLNLFIKGVVAVLDGDYYAAKSCTEEGVIDFGFPEEDDDTSGGEGLG